MVTANRSFYIATDYVTSKQRLIIPTALRFLLLMLSFQAPLMSLEISSENTKIDLDQSLQYFHDIDETHHIMMLTDPNADIDWLPATQNMNGIGMPAGVYWLSAELQNTSQQAITMVIEVESPSLGVVDLYQHNNNVLSVVYNDVGLYSPYSKRPSNHRNIVDRITFPPQSTTTLIWRVESKPLVQFKATAWQPQYFFSHDQDGQLLYGMLYGVLLVMTLYNLFLFVSTREKSYYYYVLYVITAGYMLAADEGHLYQYIFSNTEWSKMAIYAAAYSVNMIMFAQFCIYFLNLKKLSPRLTRLIRYSAITSALSLIAIAVTSNTILIYFALGSVSLVYVSALIAGIRVRVAGVISAGNFVIAIMILVFSLIATNMASLGLINSSAATDSFSAIGITMMLIFFSLALADRINQLQKENVDANNGISKANEEKLRLNAELVKSQTARIRLEQQAAQAKAESRAKSEFLAAMSHDIRTPMNGVLEMAESLKLTELDSNQHQHVDTIEQSGDALLSVIDDLQDYAKIEAGKMELEVSSFNLETLIDDCVSTFTLTACEKNINFIADISPELHPVLKGDTTKLRQIILNLLSNAFKFTEYGDIVLRVHQTQKPAINCIELHFEVQDSGIGLTDEEQQRLFSPFQQTESTTYGRYGGSGLGLAISKQLAELMDGSIGVDSERGNGANFWFTARLLVDEQPDSMLLRQKSPQLADRRVLLVNVNPCSTDIIQRALTSWQMLVTCVNSMPSAIQQVKDATQAFDIVLSDYQLDDHNGIELAKTLNKLDNNRPVCFVLMAITRQLPKQDQLTSAGIELILEKPVTRALLHDIVLQGITDPYQTAVKQFTKHNSEDNHGLKVLIVENNQADQMTLQKMLTKFHIQPDIASDGLKAIEYLDHQHYDLILMSCEMPEMDGYEATKQIRAKEKLFNRPHSTIVALSAHARSDYKNKAMQVGMNDYVTKPVTQTNLLKVIQTAQTKSTKIH